jgi:hypothetical protein
MILNLATIRLGISKTEILGRWEMRILVLGAKGTHLGPLLKVNYF